MAIRIVCPSCSAALSVKDEFAGRAVKCPKCGGTIPASQIADAQPPAVSAPPPAPQKPSFEAVDEPSKPSKSGSKVTSQPAARAKDADDKPEDEDRPKRKKRDDDRDDRDDDRDERGERKPKRRDRDRDDDRDDDDRPSKKRRRDDDDDERPRGRKGERGEKKGGGGGMVLAIIGGLLLLCCTGVGGGAYYLYTKAKEKVEQVKEDLAQWNPSVSIFNYESLQVGTTTRSQAELTLGQGKLATTEDLEKMFPNDAAKMEKWTPLVAKSRVLLWRNGEDYMLAAFHPSTETDARLQMKEWKPKLGAPAFAGESSDATFLQKYPVKNDPDNPPKKPDLPTGPPIVVSAEDLSQAFKDSQFAAETKYKDKLILVSGKLSELTMGSDGEWFVIIEGSGAGRASKIRCAVQKGDQNQVFHSARGATITFRGKCGTTSGQFVEVLNCKFDSRGTETFALDVNLNTLLREYDKNEAAADEKFKDKLIVFAGRIESKSDDSMFMVDGVLQSKTKTPIKIKVTLSPTLKEQLANVKPGDRITVKGNCAGRLDDTIFINQAWIMPK